MKMQIRKSVFETNSSSTHSICISKTKPKINHDVIVGFEIGEYGWENDTVDVKDYLYTAINCQANRDELMAQLKAILDKNNIKYYFGKVKLETYGSGNTYLENGGIDHSGETRDFINAVLNDEDVLMRLIFNDDSVVYTGNDNQDEELDGCNIAWEDIDDYIDGEWVSKPNPYHDEEKFDYFYKGN